MKQFMVVGMDFGMLAKILSSCESLSADYQCYADLAKALLRGEKVAVEKAGNEFLVSACPEEGDVYPCRGTLVCAEPRSVSFQTPAGVIVKISRDENGNSTFEVDFGRESNFLAGQMMAAICFADRRPNYPVYINGSHEPVAASAALATCAATLAEGDLERVVATKRKKP